MLNRLLEMGLVILFLLAFTTEHGEFNFLTQLYFNAAFCFSTEDTFKLCSYLVRIKKRRFHIELDG